MVTSWRTGGSGLAAARKLARLGTGLAMAALLVFGTAPAALAAAPSGLKVQDRSHDNENPDNTLYALYQIVNTSTTAVPLSSLTMRYWFTNEAPGDPLVFECDWAAVSCSNITGRFVVLSSPIAGKANTYLEISFNAAAGSVAGGRNSGEIQTRVHHVRWSQFNTNLTYSFISDESFVYKDTQTVTLYGGGALAWGVEPKA